MANSTRVDGSASFLCNAASGLEDRTHQVKIGDMQSVGEIIREKNIQFDTAFDPLSRGGFTQVPNLILREPNISVGAKLTYAMFLSYAWSNDSCFPGQERLAQDIGMSRSRVTEYVTELENAGLVTIQRRGQGKTNIYTIRFQVRSKVIHTTKG
jgi:biotin operon repressor